MDLPVLQEPLPDALARADRRWEMKADQTLNLLSGGFGRRRPWVPGIARAEAIDEVEDLISFVAV